MSSCVVGITYGWHDDAATMTRLGPDMDPEEPFASEKAANEMSSLLSLIAWLL